MSRGVILVVGAGFAGAVSARELAEGGRKVVIIDRRDHIGGNAYDTPDKHGVLVHPYGPHIFHTNSQNIVTWLSRFTDWRSYEHRVLAHVDGQLLPIPINQTTINRLYGLNLDEVGVAKFLAEVREHRETIKNSEDLVLSSVGRDLCDRFFRGYTRKQWGLDLSELSAAVAARIPTRSGIDDRYFSDSFQAMPKAGYTQMFRRILDHPAIELKLNTDFASARDLKFAHVVYTGCIDAYFGYCYGELPYRSLRFEHEHVPFVKHLQPVATVNFPNDYAYTRITEFKHMTGQVHSGTSVVREFPQASGDPYYPIPRPANEALYQQYKSLAEQTAGVTFVGRLAQYRYYNMDQVIGAALAATKKYLVADHA